jgi:hypothetical protein
MLASPSKYSFQRAARFIHSAALAGKQSNKLN